MSNKLIADLMSFRSRMVADDRTQIMFEGDFDTIDETIAELKKLSTDLHNWKDFCKKVQRQQLASQPSEPVNPHDYAYLVEEAIQRSVSNSPQPLSDLGIYLSELLDEDQWTKAEQYLLKAAITTKPSVDVLVEALRKLQAMQIVEQMDIIENALATYSKPITEDKDNG